MDRVKSNVNWAFNEFGRVCNFSPSLTKIFVGTVATMSGIRASLFGWRRKKPITLVTGVSLSVVGLWCVADGVTEILFPRPQQVPCQPMCHLWHESERALGQLPTKEETRQCVQELEATPNFSDSTRGRIVGALGGISTYCQLPVYPVDKVVVGHTGYLDQFKHEDLGLWPIWRGDDHIGRSFLLLRLAPVKNMPGCSWMQTLALFQRYTDDPNNWVGGSHEPPNRPLYLYSPGGLGERHIARLTNVTQGKPITSFFFFPRSEVKCHLRFR